MVIPMRLKSLTIIEGAFMFENGLPAIHPGEFLGETLDELHISAAELARILDLPAEQVSSVVQGTSPITAPFALLLARALDQSAQYWLSFAGRLRLEDSRRGHRQAFGAGTAYRIGGIILIFLERLPSVGGMLGQPVSGNCFPPADPHGIVALHVIEKARQGHGAGRMTADAAVEPNAHQLGVPRALLPE